jgi:hypothetical protein
VSIVVDLPPELETALADEAARLNLSLAEYALRLLAAGLPPTPNPRDGAELVNYWHNEGLIGTRSEIVDAPAHARSLREQAELRKRP